MHPPTPRSLYSRSYDFSCEICNLLVDPQNFNYLLYLMQILRSLYLISLKWICRVSHVRNINHQTNSFSITSQACD